MLQHCSWCKICQPVAISVQGRRLGGNSLSHWQRRKVERAACEKHQDWQLQKWKGFTSLFHYLASVTLGDILHSPPTLMNKENSVGPISMISLEPDGSGLRKVREKGLREKQSLLVFEAAHLLRSTQASQRPNYSDTHHPRKCYSCCPKGMPQKPNQTPI